MKTHEHRKHDRTLAAIIGLSFMAGLAAGLAAGFVVGLWWPV